MLDRRTRDPVEAAYDAWAATYDTDRNRTRDLDASVLRSRALDLSERDVLELGCGTGKNTRWIAERSRSVVALDLSERMLERARARVPGPHVRFVRADVRRCWPVRSAAVDVVVAHLVLEHIDDLTPVFSEVTRVLRPGGQLFLSELHPFRQLRGSRARFDDPETGEAVQVPAFVHQVCDFVNGGIEAGLTLLEIGEWRDEEDGANAELPRLFSAHFRLDDGDALAED